MYPKIYIQKNLGLDREHFLLLQQEVSFSNMDCKDTSLKTSIQNVNMELYSYIQIPYKFLAVNFEWTIFVYYVFSQSDFFFSML